MGRAAVSAGLLALLCASAGTARAQGQPPTTGQDPGDGGVISGGDPTVDALHNDNFAEPVALVTGTKWTGSMEGATVAADEPEPPPLREKPKRSLWFTWEAGEAGWYTVTGTGAAPGNYVALWRGTTLENIRYAHNAEGWGDNWFPRFSFRAFAGEKFRLCVADRGPGGTEGHAPTAPSLLISPAEAPPAFEVTSFTLNGKEGEETADTGAGPVTVTAQFAVRTQREPARPMEARLALLGADMPGFQFDETFLVAGTVRDGVYKVPMRIPGYLTPRRLYFAVTMLDSETWFSSQGASGDAAFSVPGEVPALTLVNTGKVDGEPPVLTSCAGSVATVDLAAEPGEALEMTLEMRDESDITRLEVRLCDGDGYGEGSAYRGGGAAPLFQVDGFPAPVRLPLYEFNSQDREGEWHVQISASDYNGNIRIWNSTEADFPGPFAGVRARNSAEADGYLMWRRDKFAAEWDEESVSGETADPDGDGLSNLMEYALAYSPTVRNADSGLTVTPGLPEAGSGSGRVVVYYGRNWHSHGVGYQLQRAPTPAGPWRAVFLGDALNPGGTGGYWLPAEDGRGFFRLMVWR